MRIGESAGPTGFTAIVLLALASFLGCVDYNATTQATRSIYSVRVVTSAAGLGDCRLIGRVNSRDEAKCGLTVQPTPEECLRYQVRRAGGDTLVINGPVGDAYDCSGGGASASAPAAAPAAGASAAPPPATPAATVPATAAQAPAPTPAAALSAPTPSAAPSAPTAVAPSTPTRARVVRERESARGCVYLGDLDPKTACPGASAEAAEECLARRGAEAHADTVVLDSGSVNGSAQLFACKATP